MDISSGQMIMIGIIALIIQYAIIMFAIHNSTVVLREQAKIQTALLTEIARKSGVTEEEIQEALNTK